MVQNTEDPHEQYDRDSIGKSETASINDDKNNR